MSKKVIVISLILSILALTACNNNVSKNTDSLDTAKSEVIQHEDNIEPSNKDIPETDPAEGENINNEDDNEAVDDIELNTHEDNPLLELARQGKVDGIEFNINTSTDEVIEKWGLPDVYDYFMGGLYFSYDDRNIIFFTDAVLSNDEIMPGNIKCIGVLEENKELYNVRVGMTFEEIIAILGEPTYLNTAEQNEESELLSGNWTIVYDVGEYDIEFVSSTENGPVDIVYLWGKN
ncbi:hypothetical protein DW1_1192 [Proteiniborus sp. DW1]|uniref:DUF4309 domain-containing protein n=1 Tax=Proteiniborus sp. DW1 TaxID=1889883 RepID=UPI00092E0A70|nr:DUF4309 domain-containing protein [Proteiniborus sp. DW1]SCG82765.1 hypothetical protein DW1_1192 [Proteiniborus sp. DW1]